MRNMPGQIMAGGHFGKEAFTCRNDPTAINNIENSKALTLPTGENFPRQVIGVVLAEEDHKTNADEGYCVGALLLDSLDISANVLRRLICKQISSLPKSFTILTKQGWPLSGRQECDTPAADVIRENQSIQIRHSCDRPKVGIVTTTGSILGFIFVDFKWSIAQVRDGINEQLTEVEKKSDFQFIEGNGWPVAASQENDLTILDIIRPNYRIYIKYCDKFEKPTPATELPKSSRELPVSTPHQNPQKKGILKNKKLKWTSRTKWSSLMKKDNNLVAKPILISYVRAEAAQHALDLKYELERQGHSVFLDVHEIKTGTDWQDALNFAVSNCQFFVPLITPMYGKTRWTNREVKLADVLQKNIIPISFIDQWPPACLAIQFASTEYICWKPSDSEDGKAEQEPKFSDIRLWEQIYVERVCKELEERCRMSVRKPLDNEKPCERQEFSESYITSSEKSINPKLVVISSHPKQNVLVHQLRVALEYEGYDVWCSSDLQSCPQSLLLEDVIPSSNVNSPRDLNSIPEGYSVLGQTYNEIASIIADSKRGSPQKNSSDNHKEEKHLTRMISQVSDISQVSSLTPDKIERLRMFQQKTELAGVVIIVVSEAYTKSKTSQQQVFYCEHRKHVVLVKFDQHPLPSWFTMLMGTEMITNVSSPQFVTTLKAQLTRAINPSSSETPKSATVEAKLQCLVTYMKKNIPQPEGCVYVAGSSNLQSARSREIARAIGKELAKIRNIKLCTGGFFGAPDIVARAFYEDIQNNKDVLLDSSENSIVHLLPFKDSKDFSSKAFQNPDGSFEAISYGKTYFAGESVKECETAVARLLDTCIVIEGGPRAAHQVEEFMWNDHFVIPVISTGGAAGGQYGVPLKILEAPPCVSEADWCLLSDKEASPEHVAEAVVNIALALKHSLMNHMNTEETKTCITTKESKTMREENSSTCKHGLQKEEMMQNQNSMSAHGHKLVKRPIVSYVSNHCTCGSPWQKFLRLLSATKIRLKRN